MLFDSSLIWGSPIKAEIELVMTYEKRFITMVIYISLYDLIKWGTINKIPTFLDFAPPFSYFPLELPIL